MYSMRRFGIKLGLDLIAGILKELKNPQNKYKTIHIAGTNGKGSIASGLASILECAGYKTGLYTSPHLIKFNERISVNKIDITDDHVVKAYEAVKNSCQHADREPTFFEFSTAMAFYEFGLQKVNAAVIETGMGGRLDATNLISPQLSVISNISVEHRTYLGNTIAKIAYEKGGIIKENTPVITGAKQKNALLTFEKLAKQKNAPLYIYGKDFSVKRDRKKGTFKYYGIYNQVFEDMRTNLIGNYQIDNAALVIAACEILNKKNIFEISPEHIKEGLEKHTWAGRLERVFIKKNEESKSPEVEIILDGAHNLAAAKNLACFLKENNHKKITTIIGILDDKPYKAILKALVSASDKALFAMPEIERAIKPDILLKEAEKIARPQQELSAFPSIKEALNYALKTSRKNEIICISGSLYTIGEAKAAIKNFKIDYRF
ncbi:MAG: bifunctional folylpolyglutamate synthase/dihydrofolate synthase [Deltaproteobacteria bacterium]|nr:bifunctional folylpolyglutamate synthase/dihydrofolate synthase [Deltaproteobacteria bacterium]